MKNAITYENRNGYLYPLLALPETEEAPIGKYGWIYLDYLKKHRRVNAHGVLRRSTKRHGRHEWFGKNARKFYAT